MTDILRATRPLGATGVTVPIIGYGTAPLGKEKNATREQAVRCLNVAIDRGITYLDTSPDYGSEPYVGEVMKTRRDEVFLATKINRRSKEGVLDEIKESLTRLQTDHIDLIQVHSISAWADLEQTLAADGAVAALEEAREQGLVRFIGITGHARPDILGHALTQYSFDTVLVALGIADRLITSPETFLLPYARERNAGVIAMKVFAHGAVTNRDKALRYSLGLPGVSTAIIGLDNEKQIEEIVKLAAAVDRPLEDDEREEFICDEIRPLLEKDAKESKEGKGKGTLFWFRDTSVGGWAQKDEPVLVEY